MGRQFPAILFYSALLGVLRISAAQEYMKMAWLEKPPYTTRRPNAEGRFNGILYDVLRTKLHYCGSFESVRVNDESTLVARLKNGQAQLAGPVVAKGIDPIRYNGEYFLALLDYPGADFLTKPGTKEFAKVVTETILDSWPLLALSIILTAIAGIVTWALDTATNPQQFPSSFLRGSWEGFWWAFISMTTVGYGDKSPKSILSRAFAMVWIQLGLIVMAIFMAVITSTLTSMSLEVTNKPLQGSTVAVLDNGTEYKLAGDYGAEPKVYGTFAEMMDALEADEVSGIFVERTSGYYYRTQDRNMSRSLVTSQHVPLTASLGLAITSDEAYINMTDCLSYMKNYIRQEILTLTSVYKAPPSPPPKEMKLFDVSEKGLLRVILIAALATLALMLIAGMIWDFTRSKKIKGNHTDIPETAEKLIFQRNSGEDLRRDLDYGKKMLRELQELFESLERKSLGSMTDAHQTKA